METAEVHDAVCEAVEVAGPCRVCRWTAVSSQKIVDTACLQFVLVRERNTVGAVNAR